MLISVEKIFLKTKGIFFIFPKSIDFMKSSHIFTSLLSYTTITEYHGLIHRVKHFLLKIFSKINTVINKLSEKLLSTYLWENTMCSIRI